MTEVNQPISFIHLSDIHFNKYSSDYYDVDLELRNELLLDIEENAKPNLTNIKGVLVCGDIAFSGQKLEYENALDFLRELCAKVEIPESMVFCVPGNHDVNQNVCKSSRILRCIQNDIESSRTLQEIDSCINDFMHDSHASILFEPLADYNEFASKFNCTINQDNPYWHDKVSINSTYTLRIHGLNSVIISNDKDHLEDGSERSMIIGNYQIPKRALNILTLTLCHHPPECWKDPAQENARLMKARSHIQLYGHKHIQTIENDGQTIIIGSGAVQPSRTESMWVPYYNWISFKIANNNGEDFLEVQVYPRIYNTDAPTIGFDADYSACDIKKNNKVYKIKIRKNREDIQQDYNESIETQEIEEIKPENMDDFINRRTLVYNLMGLPQIVRTELLKKLNLLKEGESGEYHNTMLDEIFKRAMETDRLNELWDEVTELTKGMGD